MSQRDFAKALDVEASQVNRWCRGHFQPNRFYRELIAKELKTTEEALWPKQS